ncbi:metallo-beta-lactamase domain-containing protein 1 [Coccinella septempunctata]|uniref:metallo-beta-lactamase domain-containing protein 1 n=1 Tax=Coccinella septempunctata TaxID=41139 RepID=UPI001D07EBF2|nr:metallo-beta-lactamase domain-containing protein 1 [Coccinella septempunctata]XP_044748994.1 metallo-beta-lactamase domain-containing protein 1 [Coccinella septempunctata]
MYEVIVLVNGYSNTNEFGSFANGTCTLLKGPDNIIVDTLTPWDGEKLKAELKKHQIGCDDIKYVVCTHGHSDHTGCNYLFPKAKLIVGTSISFKDKYFEHDFKGGDSYIINDFVEVLPTPGHTLEDVTVIVETRNQGLVAVTGDLFEKKEDLFNDHIWRSAGSADMKLQSKNRKLILKRVDWIVPGHGPMFKVLEEYRRI